MNSQVDYSKYYDRWHQRTDAHLNFLAGYYGRFLFPQIPGRDSKILDFGCGAGYCVEVLMRAGYSKVAGIDTSPDLISQAIGRGLPCSYVESSLEFLAKCDDRYDAVLMLDVLEHINKEDAIRYLREVRQVLRPGGRLVVTVPNADSLVALRWRYDDFTHQTAFTDTSLRTVLQWAGFQEITVSALDFSTRPRLVWIPRKSSLAWARRAFFRYVRRQQLKAELGNAGEQIPLGINLLATCTS